MKKLIVVVLVLLMVGLVSGSISSVDNDKAVDYKLIEKANSGDRPYGAPLIPEVAGDDPTSWGGDNEAGEPQWKKWNVGGWEIILYESGELNWKDSLGKSYSLDYDLEEDGAKSGDWPKGPKISSAFFKTINQNKPVGAPALPEEDFIESSLAKVPGSYKGKEFVTEKDGWEISYEPVSGITIWKKGEEIYTFEQGNIFDTQEKVIVKNGWPITPPGVPATGKKNTQTGWTDYGESNGYKIKRHDVFGIVWEKDGAKYIKYPDGNKKYLSAPLKWSQEAKGTPWYAPSGSKSEIKGDEYSGNQILMVGDSHSVGIYGKQLFSLFQSNGNPLINYYAVTGSQPSWWLKKEDVPNEVKSHTGKEKKGYFRGTSEQTTQIMPTIDYLLDELEGSKKKVVISLGSNLIGMSKNVRVQTVKTMVEKIVNSGADCYWVGPPNGPNKPKLKLAELIIDIKQGISDSSMKCPYIDSRAYTQAFECVNPEGCRDSKGKLIDAHLHNNGKEGIELAKIWAQGSFEEITTGKVSESRKQASAKEAFFDSTPVSDGAGGTVPVVVFSKPVDQACQDVNKCREIDRVWEQIRGKLSVTGDAKTMYWVPTTGKWETFERLYVPPTKVVEAKKVDPKVLEVTYQKIKTPTGINVPCVVGEGTPEYRAILDTISYSELGASNSHRYDLMFAFKKMSDFGMDYSKHPREFPNHPEQTDSGRYQFVKGTYDTLKKAGQFKNGFYPKDQDAAAIYYVNQKGVSQSDLEGAAGNSDNFERVRDKLDGTWLGMKSSSKKPHLNGVFQTCLAFHKELK